MRKALTYSLAAHVVVVGVSYVGLPALRRPPPPLDSPLIVDVVLVSDQTNVAPPESKPEPKKEEQKPPPPAPKAAPPPAAEPEPVLAAEPPPKLEPKPKPQAKPLPKPKAPPTLVKVKPRRKPKPPDPFASVLRTVEKLKRQPRPAEKPDDERKPEKKIESFETQMARAIPSATRRHDPSRPLSISQIDLVKRQIFECWSVQAGAKDAKDLLIEIHLVMNADGFVRSAEIKDRDRLQSDPFFRSAAESALRAVLNKHCQPFKLPRDRYDEWQTITMTFNPREMLR